MSAQRGKPPKPRKTVESNPPATRRRDRTTTASGRDGGPGLSILMVASEAQPFSKTGGLADVANSLTRALGRLGHDVTLVTPRYRGVESGTPRGTARAQVAGYWFEAHLHDVPLGPGARAILVDCPPLYDRVGIYAESNTDYGDNPIRYAFLSIAALEWAAMQATPPAIVHAHDWQAGLTPIYARTHFDRVWTGRGIGAPTVFTIHNIAYQGVVDKEWVPRLGLRWEDYRVNGFEFWDRLSLLKAGVMFSDALTTVSPTYAEEIQRPEYGYGFDGVMASRRSVLTGILNGIDVDEWNPATDRFLPEPFDADNLGGKRAAKRAMLDAFGLSTDQASLERPVIGMVSRMVEQKGLDLIAWLAPELARLDAAWVVVGTGDQRFEDMWRWMSAVAPDRISAHIGFDERRAHLVEGGADLFLMPSRYEPCGLNQMYSMRYGTVPVVRAVGGLVDTVRPFNPRNGQGTGFLFAPYEASALFDALTRALAAYRQPKLWRRLQVNGMKKDFSWRHSASEYVKVYKRVIAARRKSRP
jgi:starch synthase